MTAEPKTHASFTCAEPPADDPDAAPGRALAGRLAAGLAAAGLSVTPIEDLGFAQGFRCDVGRRRFFLTVGLVDDGPREWLLVIDPWTGALARIFGGGDRAEHAQLATAVHAALAGDAGVAELRWYDERAWGASPETDWTAEPC